MAQEAEQSAGVGICAVNISNAFRKCLSRQLAEQDVPETFRFHRREDVKDFYWLAQTTTTTSAESALRNRLNEDFVTEALRGLPEEMTCDDLRDAMTRLGFGTLPWVQVHGSLQCSWEFTATRSSFTDPMPPTRPSHGSYTH